LFGNVLRAVNDANVSSCTAAEGLDRFFLSVLRLSGAVGMISVVHSWSLNWRSCWSSSFVRLVLVRRFLFVLGSLYVYLWTREFLSWRRNRRLERELQAGILIWSVLYRIFCLCNLICPSSYQV
jgi:hypothetical protein